MSRKQKLKHPDQLDLPGIDVKKALPREKVLQKMEARLERRSHWAPPGKREGAPRVYAFSGTKQQLRDSPDKLPHCPLFYASQEIFGHVTPQLGGDALAQWCLHGEELSKPGCRFHAYSIHHHDWIGQGGVSLEDGFTMATLEAGAFRDFARFEKDAHGLILVFFTTQS